MRFLLLWSYAVAAFVGTIGTFWAYGDPQTVAGPGDGKAHGLYFTVQVGLALFVLLLGLAGQMHLAQNESTQKLKTLAVLPVIIALLMACDGLLLERPWCLALTAVWLITAYIIRQARFHPRRYQH